MAYTVNSFDTEHQGIIHDVQFDYYGKRLATGASDGKIQIFEIINDNQKKVGEIVGHESSVWQVCWSHPRFGSLLGSCGFDKKVMVCRDSGKSWDKLLEYNEHKNSVNCISFAPQEYGLILLCGSSDGTVSIHEYRNDNWHSVKITAHGFGVNGVSWGPAAHTKHENNGLGTVSSLRFVSCGMDNLIKVWQSKDNTIDSFYVLTTLEAHEDVVRDVAWRKNTNSSQDVIVSGGDDNIVYLWLNSNEEVDQYSNNPSEWKKFELRRFAFAVSKLSWDENGNHLAVSTTDGTVYLYKEQSEGVWDLISMTNSEGVISSVLDQEK